MKVLKNVLDKENRIKLVIIVITFLLLLLSTGYVKTDVHNEVLSNSIIIANGEEAVLQVNPTHRTGYFGIVLNRQDSTGELKLVLSQGSHHEQLEIPLSAFTEGWRVEISTETAFQKTSPLNIGISYEGTGGSIEIDAMDLQYEVVSPSKMIISVLALLLILAAFLIAEIIDHKEFRLDEKFWSVVIVILSTLIAIVIKVVFVGFESADYAIFNVRWVQLCRDEGVVGALGQRFTDYSPLSTTLIALSTILPFSANAVSKFLPNVLDFALALGGVCLLREVKGRRGAIVLEDALCYSALLLNPIVVMNSGIWAQCDVEYTVFMILGLLFLMRDLKAALPMFAIAFALKLQAVFIIPFLGFVWIMKTRKSLKLTDFMCYPVIFVASCLPMYIAGCNMSKLILSYFDQTVQYSETSMRYPNFYSILRTDDPGADKLWGFGMMIFVLVILFALVAINLELNKQTLFQVAAISIAVVCFFCPGMHERYGYVAEILLVLVAFMDRRAWRIVVPYLGVTCLMYCDYLTVYSGGFRPLSDYILAVVRAVCIAILIKNVMCLGGDEKSVG